MNERNDIPMGVGAQVAQDMCQEKAYYEPSLRDLLEKKRAELAERLAKVDTALQVLYSNPQAAQIYEILKRAR